MFQKVNKYVYIMLWIIAIMGLIFMLLVFLSLYLSAAFRFEPYEHILTKWENDDFELYILDPKEYGNLLLGILVYTSSEEPEIWNFSFQHDSSMTIYTEDEPVGIENRMTMTYYLKSIDKGSCILTAFDSYRQTESDVFPEMMKLKLTETYISSDDIPYGYRFDDIRTYKQTEWFAYGRRLNTFSLNISEDGTPFLTSTDKNTEENVIYETVFDSESEITIYKSIENNDGEEIIQKLYTYKLFCFSPDAFYAVCENLSDDEKIFSDEIYFTRKTFD
ncbi:MAG: hypothetical protein IJE40_07405 [Clostridia bacterium]|nr:hypothetical protein [Clostridia bacterium]